MLNQFVNKLVGNVYKSKDRIVDYFSLRLHINQKRPLVAQRSDFHLVVLLGFEPRQTGPESVVLPLHHKTIKLFDDAKVQKM